MLEQEQVKEAMERTIKAISLRPAIGQGVENMRVVDHGDGCCMVRDGDQEMVIELGEEDGGKGTTPSPGFYVRAAFGACAVMGYRVWAAYFDVPVERIEVELQTEYDMRGCYDLDETVTANYTACRCIVEIESSAPREKVLEVIDHADANGFMHCLFAEEMPLELEVRVVRPEPVQAAG